MPSGKRIKQNTVETENILKALEETESAEPLDEMGVKRLILQFEKRMLQNQEMRVKFPDEPAKFMESEIELNVAVQVTMKFK